MLNTNRRAGASFLMGLCTGASMRSDKDIEDTVSERTGPYRTAMVQSYGRQQRLPSPAKTRQLDVNLVIFSESRAGPGLELAGRPPLAEP